MQKNEWLKIAIIDYLKRLDVQRPDCITICDHFFLSADITLKALSELVEEGRIVRHDWLPGKHYYEVATS
jgi:hypothetical protein